MSAGRFSLIIAAVAVVAIVAVVVASGGRGGSDSAPARDAPAGEEATPAEPEEPAEAWARPGSGRVRSRLDLPENPDDIRGSDPYALTRTRNLRRGLAVLDRERRHVEGVFESLR